MEVDSEFARLFFQNMHYIEESDYEAAKAYLPDPESYDFNKILSGEV